jgi:LacI family transcriptional regulator
MADGLMATTSRRARQHRPLVVMATRSRQELAPEVVSVLLRATAARGWRLLDLNLTDHSLSDDQAPIGAIVTVLPTEPLTEKLRRMGCAIVRLGKLEHPDDSVRMPAVLPDLRQAGRMVAAYFAHRGFGDLGLVGHENLSTMEPIEAGLRDKAGDLGCKCHVYRFTNIDGPDTGDRAALYDKRTHDLAEWLAALPRPVALFSGNDYEASRLTVMCQRAGWSVPEDVAVMALSERSTTCEVAPVALSAVDSNRQEAARVAVGLLADLIEGRPVPARTFVAPGSIVTRRSTDILAVDDPLVARTIRFMWDHLDEALSVDVVAEEMRTPRHRLERAFRKHLKRGVSAELRRVRLERCCQLLRSTNLTMAKLAPQVGFRTGAYLHDAFVRTYGITPRQYRLQGREAEERDG